MYYGVTLEENGWKCTCRYHTHGGRKCKHIRAVSGLVMREQGLIEDGIKGMLITALRPQRPGLADWLIEDGIKGMLIKEPEPTCRFCLGTACDPCGTRRNKSGKVHRYRCNGCGRRLVHNPGSEGRHFSPSVITDALQDCATGLSPAKVVERMAKNEISIGESTIRRWIRDYGGLIERFRRKTKIPVGYTWHVDEIYFKSGGKPMWLFGVMDAKTRQIIAYECSEKKFGYDATGLFRDAVEIAGHYPDTERVLACARPHAGEQYAEPRHLVHVARLSAGHVVCRSMSIRPLRGVVGRFHARTRQEDG